MEEKAKGLNALNKDLELLATMALVFIATGSDKVSKASFDKLNSVSKELNGDILKDSWDDNDVVSEFVKALNNLKEITEAYNDLEYSEGGNIAAI